MERWATFVLILSLATATPAWAEPTAGPFQWPFTPFADYKRDQYFMEYNDGFSGYHLGDDWNGKGGESTDLGKPLYAIAHGRVMDIDDRTDPDSIGKIVRVRHRLADGRSIESVFYHVNEIYVVVGEDVWPGKLIATIGDANGYYVGSKCPPGVLRCAHLHWEARTDINQAMRLPGYESPLTFDRVAKYMSPGLFVDDRAYQFSVSLTSRQWTVIPMNFNAPSSTAYIEVAGERYSLKRAVEAGLIWRTIWSWSGAWSTSDAETVVFESGRTYYVWTWVSGARLSISVPGHKFRDDRARTDMVRLARMNTDLKDIRTETYSERDLNYYGPNFELRRMEFGSRSGPTVHYCHATDKRNPLIRWTARCGDPWTQEDPNRLQ